MNASVRALDDVPLHLNHRPRDPFEERRFRLAQRELELANKTVFERGREAMVRVLTGTARHFRYFARRRRHILPPDLLRGVIETESAFRPCAVSPKGAMGLMQLMPQTAKDLGINNAYDPIQNLGGSVAYLRSRLALFADKSMPGGGMSIDALRDASPRHFLRHDRLKRRLVDWMRNGRRSNRRLAADIDAGVATAVAELDRGARPGAMDLLREPPQSRQEAIVVDADLAPTVPACPLGRREARVR